MNTLTLFALEIGLSLLVSWIVVTYIRGVLNDLLVDVCPTAGGLFWVRTLTLLQYLVPLLLVIWRSELSPNIDPILQLKRDLFWILVGHCGVMLFLSRVIWNSLVVPATTANAEQTTTSTPQ